MQIDCHIDGWPQDAGPEGGFALLTEGCVTAAKIVVPEFANDRLEISVMFTSDEQIHALNREWRGRDKPTNVLSFPMTEPARLMQADDNGPPVMLGDIALAFETCQREAVQKGVPLEDHAAHLIVHGLLHCAGYDHETSEKDADTMEALERRILAQMGISDPYKHCA